MAAVVLPVLELHVGWRSGELNTITNDSFEVDTSGWSVAAGINGLATSITRTVADFWEGIAAADLVTTATSGSGVNWDTGTTTFTSGRAYRFKLRVKSVSGTTSAKLIIGSEGTPGDRATATMTITTAWVEYAVDWTPSANRTDVQAVLSNNAASIMTARLDDAQLFEVLDDISADVLEIGYDRGARFDGGTESPGQLVIRLRNDTRKYNPDNASSPLTGLLKIGRTVWARAVYDGIPYGLFAGVIRRIIPLPSAPLGGFAELHCADFLFRYGRLETSVALSTTRTLRDFRGAILDDIGEPAARRDLTLGGVESNIPWTYADQALAAGRLEAVNAATGSLHWSKPSPRLSLGYQYKTLDRTVLQVGASVQTWDDADLASPWAIEMGGMDLSDETIRNRKRVGQTGYIAGTSTTEVWVMDALPFTVDAGATRTLWASFSAPVQSLAVVYTASGSPAVVLTAFSSSAKIAITAGAAATVTALSLTGIAATVADSQTETVEDATSITTYGEWEDAALTSDMFPSHAEALGLGAWIVKRYKDPKPRPTLTFENTFPAQLTRDIGDRVTVTSSRLSLSARPFYIRHFRTEVADNRWHTTYDLEEAPATDTLGFTLDVAGKGLDDAAGGTEGKLLY